jgi:hypothetical protein
VPSLIVGALAAGVGYVSQLVLKRRIMQDNVKVMMCNTCHRIKRPDGIDRCDCGRTYEDFDDWTWIDK